MKTEYVVVAEQEGLSIFAYIYPLCTCVSCHTQYMRWRGPPPSPGLSNAMHVLTRYGVMFQILENTIEDICWRGMLVSWSWYHAWMWVSSLYVIMMLTCQLNTKTGPNSQMLLYEYFIPENTLEYMKWLYPHLETRFLQMAYPA